MKAAPAGGSLWGIEMGMAFRRTAWSLRREPVPGKEQDSLLQEYGGGK